jgi:vacuolar-type H+-ATPase subunit I/STV1
VLARWPPGRRIAAAGLVAFCAAVLAVTILGGWSASTPLRLVQTVGLILMIVGVIGLLISLFLLSSWRRGGTDRTVVRDRDYY